MKNRHLSRKSSISLISPMMSTKKADFKYSKSKILGNKYESAVKYNPNQHPSVKNPRTLSKDNYRPPKSIFQVKSIVSAKNQGRRSALTGNPPGIEMVSIVPKCTISTNFETLRNSYAGNPVLEKSRAYFSENS